ncbi:dihydrofolate reductase family protein [Candidatus Poriferisodalis sp.]|uniref:dihydrofolate reductase family protein n=1 Tax=Candidatus Poriferisodalis sp. TaxID=3101277 RepID=UPI003B013D0B
MHRLYPLPSSPTDPATASGPRRVSHAQRPWLLLNMVASIDGAAAVDGRSRGLSSSPDRAMFDALRARADLILVGARTANAERYGPPQRAGGGSAGKPGARIAVVSGTLSVCSDLPLFGSHPPPAPLPLVVTTTDADAAAADRFAGRAELMRVGEGSVDLSVLMSRLGSQGAQVVLCEGGPALNASLLAADLVDEVNLTHAPLAVGRDSPRIASASGDAPATAPRGFTLEQVVVRDGVLFVRWTRARR